MPETNTKAPRKLFTIRDSTTAEPFALVIAESAEQAAFKYAESLGIKNLTARAGDTAEFSGYLGAARYNFAVKEGEPGNHARAYWLGVKTARNMGRFHIRNAPENDPALMALAGEVRAEDVEGIKTAWRRGYNHEKAAQRDMN